MFYYLKQAPNALVLTALDSLYKQEFNDTLSSIKSNYLKQDETRNFSLGSLNSQIKQLSTQKEEAQQ